jgi:hypothetical protein
VRQPCATLLTLEFINGADLCSVRQAQLQEIDLHVVRGDDEDIVEGYREDRRAALLNTMLQQVRNQLRDRVGFRRGGLCAPLMLEPEKG